MRGLIALVGLVMVSAGAALYSLPAGLIIFGAGLYVDATLRNK